MHVFVLLPSARGIHPNTAWGLMDMRTAMEKAGHFLHGASVYRMPLDLARNEMAAVFLSTTADLALLLDDDVWLSEPAWLPKMLKADLDIVTVPCLLRDHSHGGAQDGSIFNVWPQGEVIEIGGLRVLECYRTGLGAVLVKRAVLQKLYDTETHYSSHLLKGKEAAAIFNSCVVPANTLDPRAPLGMRCFIMDDVVFSQKVLNLGFKIHAAIDVPSVHDGMLGCFSEAASRLDRARAKVLIGPDGKSL